MITLNEDVITVKEPHRGTLIAPNKKYGFSIKLTSQRTHLIYTNPYHRLTLFEGGSSVLWLERVRGVGELDSPLRPFTAALWEREELTERARQTHYFLALKTFRLKWSKYPRMPITETHRVLGELSSFPLSLLTALVDGLLGLFLHKLQVTIWIELNLHIELSPFLKRKNSFDIKW